MVEEKQLVFEGIKQTSIDEKLSQVVKLAKEILFHKPELKYYQAVQLAREILEMEEDEK
jgi:uncharacterized Zn finger protein